MVKMTVTLTSEVKALDDCSSGHSCLARIFRRRFQGVIAEVLFAFGAKVRGDLDESESELDRFLTS